MKKEINKTSKRKLSDIVVTDHYEIIANGKNVYFGMCEMEAAAARIIQACKNAKAFSRNFCAYDFGIGAELNGFLELIYYGWMDRDGIDNGFFIPNEKFWNKIFEK